ncbi:MAG: 6-phosphogluconolactonase [Rubrobacter sp.]|nr:6-phosphogluconolactonase [Rubrobacter sp.]
MSIEVYESPQELAEAAARDFAARAEEAVGRRSRFVVALAGGSTPEATYEALAREYAGSSFWSSTHVFFGDERPVPPDHEDSNYRMAETALLRHVSPASVHRMRGELPPAQAAREYEQDLRGLFGDEGGLPVFDLVHLGLGDDGHTASLFPGTAALDTGDRWAVENPVEKLGVTRLTLTAPAINAARAVHFLVAGEGKADAVKEVLQGDADPREYPAKLIRPAGELAWLLDRAADGRLDHQEKN